MSDTAIQALLYVAILILPLSALAARRLPLSVTIRYALAWIGIFVAALLIVASFT